MTPQEREALNDFARAVEAHYGKRLVDMRVFGSRARGDNCDESDADIAVVLDDDNLDYWKEKFALLDMSYDGFVETGLYIQPWPISKRQWDDPDRHSNPRFVRNVHRDAKPLSEAA